MTHRPCFLRLSCTHNPTGYPDHRDSCQNFLDRNRTGSKFPRYNLLYLSNIHLLFGFLTPALCKWHYTNIVGKSWKKKKKHLEFDHPSKIINFILFEVPSDSCQYAYVFIPLLQYVHNFASQVFHFTFYHKHLFFHETQFSSIF